MGLHPGARQGSFAAHGLFASYVYTIKIQNHLGGFYFLRAVREPARDN